MSQASELERQMLDLINAERSAYGLNPVQLELRLNASAEDHSEWMLAQNVFSHTGVDGTNAGERMSDAGFQFSGSWSWAENIAWQTARGAPGLADDVVNLHDSLMNSSGHRANILNASVEVIGIGIEQGNFNGWDAVMVTQNFARTGAAVELDTGTGSGGNDGGGSSDSVATAGDDRLALSAEGMLQGLAGNDTLSGSSGRDTLSGGSGKDKLTGGNRGDEITGDRGNDTIRGNQGADDLTGGGGNDKIWGGSGGDRLNGNKGNDRLVGNGGGDLFVFSSGHDTVKDFDLSKNNERIDLSSAAGITGFEDLMSSHVIQTTAGLRINDTDGDTMLLEGILLQQLNANDFLF